MIDARTGRRRAAVAFATTAAVNVAALLTPEVGGAGLALPGADKIVHVALFVLLAAASRWCFGARRAALGALVAYGALTELAQGWWLAGRGGDVRDLVADAAGIALGWFAAGAWRPATLGSVAATTRPGQVVR